jgi:hypothetical protein
MIAHGAEHTWLQVVKGYVIRKAADVQFGVVITVRIAATIPFFARGAACSLAALAYREAAGLGSSRASRIKLQERTRKLVVLQLRLEAGQRFCRLWDESRSSTALVPIAAWPACADITAPEAYEARYLIQRRPAIILR